jgi:hypothetical protein
MTNERLIELYQAGASWRTICAEAGLTRQRCHQKLRALGIRKRRLHSLKRCGYSDCQNLVKRTRALERNLGERSNRFCCVEHYYASRLNPRFIYWRQGLRIARAEVARYFPLEPQHIVHHADSDERNNTITNLWVFANSSDHMRHHHGRPVTPIWRGDRIGQPEHR